MKVEINQKAMQIDGEPTETVLEFLRRHGLKGTKEGCASGDCGACTVMLADTAIHADGQRHSFKTFNACIAPIGQFVGESIITVGGLAGLSRFSMWLLYAWFCHVSGGAGRE